MNFPLRLLLLCPVLIGCLLLASCIDSHEEVWLKSDGSGRAELRFSLPAAATVLHGGEKGIRAIVDDFLAKSPQLKDSSSTVALHRGRMEIKVSASFDSIIDFSGIPASEAVATLPEPSRDFAGTVDVRIEGRTVEFTRTIHAGKAIPGSFLIPSSQMKKHRLVYILHLPSPVLESNATRTENSGRTLIWDHSLAIAARNPFSIHVKTEIPLPRWLLASAGGTVLLLSVLATAGIRRLRSRRRVPMLIFM